MDGKTFTESFELKKDPRLATTPEDFQKQFALLSKIRDKLTETHNAITGLRQVDPGFEDFQGRYITLGYDTMKDPDTGVANVGIWGDRWHVKQALVDPESEQVRRLIEELGALDPKLSVESYNFVLDEKKEEQ